MQIYPEGAILKYLKGAGRASVGDIAGEIKLSFKATSKHLTILFHAYIVEKEQSGLTVFYSLAADRHPVVRTLLGSFWPSLIRANRRIEAGFKYILE